MVNEGENLESDPQREMFSRSIFADKHVPTSLKLGTVTHIGHRRKQNQDHYAVIRRHRFQELIRSDLPLDDFKTAEDTAYLLIVADGIGGSAFGELASRLVIQKIWELTTRASCWIMRIPQNYLHEAKERLAAYAEELQQYLTERSEGTAFQLDLGTTVTSTYVIGRNALISHVGDSRAYLLREGELKQLTKDQTVAQKLIDLGYEPEQVTEFHRVLANYFGTNMKGTPEVAIRHLELQLRDRLLLCTDGLPNELTAEEICDLLNACQDPQITCEALLQAALDHGGRDNITIIVAEIDS